jgi:hypothetical protein
VAVYQRERASGGYTTVHQGRGAQPVAVRLATVVWR